LPKPINRATPFIHLLIKYHDTWEQTHRATPYELARIKMKKLGGGGIPQDAGLSDFLKNKLQKIPR
jgi:hypothetical protein